MSKILFLANDFATIYNFRREQLDCFSQEGFEIVISVPECEKNEYFRNRGIRVVPVALQRSGTNPLKDVLLLKSYISLLKKEKPDIVLTYTVKPNSYGSLACRLVGVPYINNVTGLGSKFQKDDIVKHIITTLQKAAFKSSSCIFFQNSENLETLKEMKIIKHKNTRLLPGSGVNLQLHRSEEYPEDNGVDFITVSRIRADKGFHELFEAAEKVKAVRSDVRFHVVGDVEDEDFLPEVKRLGDNKTIIFHGGKTQEEVHGLIKNSHCLIHPSYHEGMANVLLEASAAARACLASDIAGCREAVDEGETGFLFKSQDSESLEKAIMKFLDINYDDRKKMGLCARKKMEREFDREYVIKAYLEEINKALSIRSKEYVSV